MGRAGPTSSGRPGPKQKIPAHQGFLNIQLSSSLKIWSPHRPMGRAGRVFFSLNFALGPGRKLDGPGWAGPVPEAHGPGPATGFGVSSNSAPDQCQRIFFAFERSQVDKNYAIKKDNSRVMCNVLKYMYKVLSACFEIIRVMQFILCEEFNQ